MIKTISFVAIVIAVSLAACKSADNKVPEIASDMCNCFSATEKNISKSTKDLFVKAANDDDPQKVLQQELIKLDPEDQVVINQELMSLSELQDEKSEIGNCMKNVEKKYGNAYTRDKNKLGDKIVSELESKKGCDFTASIMKMGLKIDRKNTK